MQLKPEEEVGCLLSSLPYSPDTVSHTPEVPLGWPASELPGRVCLHLHPEVAGSNSHTQLFIWVQRIRVQAPHIRTAGSLTRGASSHL